VLSSVGPLALDSLLRALVFVRVVATRCAGPYQSPIRIKALGRAALSPPHPPLATVWPQKTVGARPCPS